MNNLKIYILDKNMNLVKNGNKGEICVSGDCLALGYVGKEPIEKGSGAGKDKFLPNPFREESESKLWLQITHSYSAINSTF